MVNRLENIPFCGWVNRWLTIDLFLVCLWLLNVDGIEEASININVDGIS